jgi:hypothetical protein
MRNAWVTSVCCLWALAGAASFARAGTVITLPPSGITTNSVTLNGVANPSGTTYFGYFQYGTTTNYGSTTASQPLGGGNSNTNFSQLVSGLMGGQLYHYRAAINSLFSPSIFGNDAMFIIPALPAAITSAATSIHPGQAMLNAIVNPNGLSATWWF